MRIIAKFDNLSLAEKFSQFLENEGIENSIDTNFDLGKEKTEASLWVHDEDELEKANELYHSFSKDSDNPIYDPKPLPPKVEDKAQKSLPPIEKPKEKKALTLFFIFLCSALFFLSALQTIAIGQEGREKGFLTPTEFLFLYDIPEPILMLRNYLESQKKPYAPTSLKDLTSMQIDAINQIFLTPSWKGYYALILSHKEKRPLALSPPFHQIKQGQVWRVFTPALLHGGLLHILFNMLWLWVLGSQVEGKLSFFRYLLLIFILGIVSNTAQYLVSGPMFFGFSGVILGLAGFIWSRQKVAPWEGHLIHPSTFIFLAFFILATVFYQVLAFVLAQLNIANLPGFLANTAHIVGALTGVILGRLSFFSWRGR
jgi:GlpG protein